MELVAVDVHNVKKPGKKYFILCLVKYMEVISLSSIYKDGKYYKAKLNDGKTVHLGTVEKIVEIMIFHRKV